MIAKYPGKLATQGTTAVVVPVAMATDPEATAVPAKFEISHDKLSACDECTSKVIEMLEPRVKVRVRSLPVTLASSDEPTPAAEWDVTLEAPQFSVTAASIVLVAAALPVLEVLLAAAADVLVGAVVCAGVLLVDVVVLVFAALLADGMLVVVAPPVDGLEALVAVVLLAVGLAVSDVVEGVAELESDAESDDPQAVSMDEAAQTVNASWHVRSLNFMVI